MTRNEHLDDVSYHILFEKPQTYRQLLRLTKQILSEKRMDVFKIFLLAYIPSSIFANSLGRLDGMLSSDWILNILIFIISLVIVMVGYVALIQLTHHVVHELPTDWKKSTSEGYQRFGLTLLNITLSTVYSLLWSVLLVLPGIWAAFRYFFVLPITVIKGMKGHDALDYSSELAKGRWFQFFFLFLTYFVLYLCVNYSAEFLLNKILPAFGAYTNAVIACLLSGLLEIAYLIFTTLLFINLDFTGRTPLTLEPYDPHHPYEL